MHSSMEILWVDKNEIRINHVWFGVPDYFLISSMLLMKIAPFLQSIDLAQRIVCKQCTHIVCAFIARQTFLIIMDRLSHSRIISERYIQYPCTPVQFIFLSLPHLPHFTSFYTNIVFLHTHTHTYWTNWRCSLMI